MADIEGLTGQARSAQRIGFFEILFGDTEGFLCISTSDPRAPRSSWSDKFYEWPRESLKVENFILASEKKLNVYYCPILLTKRERKKEYCMETDLLWSDLDHVNPDSIDDYPPTIVVRSSPGRWQALWRLTTKLDPFQAQDYSRRLAYHLDADKSGWDLGQVLRVPFTINYKYDTKVDVQLQRLSEIRIEPRIFELLPADVGSGLSSEVPALPDEADGSLDAEMIQYKYGPLLQKSAFYGLYMQDPPDNAWSQILWRLLHECLRVGMSVEETFIVARSAKCNKYARDGRPIQDLWRDVIKAAQEYQAIDINTSFLQMPSLVEEDDPRITKTFVDEYRDWASEATDAIEDFHDISILVVLSSIIGMSVKLETSVGPITPNIWGLILGDSTLTRKTTAMRMAIDFVLTLDPSLIVATDGTAEGLLSGLSMRPNRASIFYKDEISGLFDKMNKQDYLAGMQETFTALYDVPPITTRRLRKETIVIESPAFCFLCGGVPDRVSNSIEDSFVLSGFLPRFLVVSGEADVDDRRPLGPPTEAGLTKKPALLSKMADLYELYATEAKQKIGGQNVMMPPRYTARMTAEAWTLNAEIEAIMLQTAKNSIIKDLALPTMDRMSKSMLKIAVILAAVRQKPNADGAIEVNVNDLVNAATYIQRWGQNSIDLIVSAGKGSHEKFLERVFEFINQNPGTLHSMIMRRFHLNSRDAAAIAQTLYERNMIRKEQRGRGYAYWIA